MDATGFPIVRFINLFKGQLSTHEVIDIGLNHFIYDFVD